MAKQQSAKSKKSTKAKAQQKTAPKAPDSHGALNAVRIGRAIDDSNTATWRQKILHANKDGSVDIRETQVSVNAEKIALETKKRAVVRGGRISELAQAQVLGSAELNTKEVASLEDALYRLPKLASRYAKLAKASREGDAEAKEKAKRVLAAARGLCKLHGLDLNTYEKFNESLDPVPTEQPANKGKGKAA